MENLKTEILPEMLSNTIPAILSSAFHFLLFPAVWKSKINGFIWLNSWENSAFFFFLFLVFASWKSAMWKEMLSTF